MLKSVLGLSTPRIGIRWASSRPKRMRVRRPRILSSKDKFQNDGPKKPREELPPYKFGSYGGLKLPDEKSREGIARLVKKVDDFNSLKLLPEIRKALVDELKHNTVLRSQNYVSPTKKIKTEGELNGLVLHPTPIQTAAVKIITSKRPPGELLSTFALAAETGSGKTWAYLAPLLQSMREEDLQRGHIDFVTIGEDKSSGDGETRRTKSKAGIRSVILVPTHELVDQVYTTLEHTGSTLGTRPFKWDVDSNFKVFMAAFRQGIDVLVTTPPKLLSLTRYDSVKHPRALLGSVKFCVVDEADTLMDDSFVEDTYEVIKNMSNLNTLVFASATFPARFQKTMAKLFPKAVPITTPALHKLPKAIEFRVINASVSPYKGSKIKALAQALYAIHCDGSEQGYEKRVIVFVNSKDECEGLAKKLHSKYGNDTTYISGDDTTEERHAKVQAFINPPKKLDDPKRPTLKVLVCTDLLSRGLNFTSIRNVVLMDVPKNSADLVHRAGRTGRMNQSGRVFLIIDDHDKSHVKGLPKVLRNNRRLG